TADDRYASGPIAKVQQECFIQTHDAIAVVWRPGSVLPDDARCRSGAQDRYWLVEFKVTDRVARRSFGDATAATIDGQSVSSCRNVNRSRLIRRKGLCVG